MKLNTTITTTTISVTVAVPRERGLRHRPIETLTFSSSNNSPRSKMRINEVFHFSNGSTPGEIRRATELLVYSDISTNQLICPITQQNFLPTDNILRIRHCGHFFSANGLRSWLRSHHDCPMCRYDIRSTTVSPAIETMLRDIASQTLSPRDLSNNSTTYQYSVFTSSFSPLNILNNS